MRDLGTSVLLEQTAGMVWPGNESLSESLFLFFFFFLLVELHTGAKWCLCSQRCYLLANSDKPSFLLLLTTQSKTAVLN